MPERAGPEMLCTLADWAETEVDQNGWLGEGYPDEALNRLRAVYFGLAVAGGLGEGLGGGAIGEEEEEEEEEEGTGKTDEEVRAMLAELRAEAAKELEDDLRTGRLTALGV